MATTQDLFNTINTDADTLAADDVTLESIQAKIVADKATDATDHHALVDDIVKLGPAIVIDPRSGGYLFLSSPDGQTVASTPARDGTKSAKPAP